MTAQFNKKSRARAPLASLATDIASRLDRPVALVGMMGSGKSAVGRKLAKALDIGFKDSDQQVVKTAGLSIAEIFDVAGEAKFRQMEFVALQSILSTKPQIIATGGGAFCQEKTANLLRQGSLVIWLKASPATLLSRIGNTKSRPLLNTNDPLTALSQLLDRRTPFYEKAHIHINTDGLTTQRAVSVVLEWLDTTLVKQ